MQGVEHVILLLSLFYVVSLSDITAGQQGRHSLLLMRFHVLHICFFCNWVIFRRQNYPTFFIGFSKDSRNFHIIPN